MDYSLQQPHKKWPLNFDLLIPFLKFKSELEQELRLHQVKILFQNEKFIACEKLSFHPIWAQDWWPDSVVIPFQNKSEAVKILKSQKNLGVYYQTHVSPRAANLRRELRELPLKRIEYAGPSKFNFKYFAWSILDSSHLIVCEKPVSRYPLGWNEFQEDKDTPPNRAYLKLWEIICLGYIQLQPTDVAIDLGSSPGGWTWVLSQQLGKVYSVDKAPLSDKIKNSPAIVSFEEDAFKLKPSQFPDCTWLFSDIICTPERLYELVQNWLQNSKVQNFVCTIKFKGPCDFEILQKFLTIQNSKIIHLYQNKNEVTWIKQGPG
jgi:23S rRNA (cytidine2498-2'-O)-methyltransferase